MKPRKRKLKGRDVFDARWIGPDGREKMHGPFKLAREAKAYAEEQEYKIRRGTYIDPDKQDTPLLELFEDYIEAAERSRTKLTRMWTRDNLGEIGGYRIGALKESHIRTWISDLREEFEDSSVTLMLVHLKAVLNRAIDDDLIVKSPARRISVPRIVTPVEEADVPTPEQVNALIVALRDGAKKLLPDDLKGARDAGGRKRYVRDLAANPGACLAVEIGANTGLRPGEVVGLKVKNIDELRSSLVVVQQAKGADLKTRSSRRRVSVDAETMQLIQNYVQVQSLGANDYLLRNLAGKPMTYNQLSVAFNKARALCDFPNHLAFHSLRHFNITMQLRAGVPVSLVAARAGHASAITTMVYYAHWLPEDDVAAAGVARSALSRAKVGQKSGLRVVN